MALLQPPHRTYWRRIPSPGGSFSLSTSPIPAFTSATFHGGPHRVHGRHQSFPRNPSSHAPLSHQLAGTLNECFSSGRANAHVPTTIKYDNDQQLASAEDAVRHASEVAGLGPVQNSAAPGSSIDRQAGYYRGAGSYPSAPMGNSSPLGHNHIRIPQFENATTQYTGHDRTGVGGGCDNNIDAMDMHAGSGGLPLPAEYPTVQPICKQGDSLCSRDDTRLRHTLKHRAHSLKSSVSASTSDVDVEVGLY